MPRVLVVDDSLSVRKMVERALETKGLEVIAASSGAEDELLKLATPTSSSAMWSCQWMATASA
jgi:CheY-like chemotaxis protein